MPNNGQPNFDEEFDEAVAEWREEHRLREDDAVMLLVDLFRIHQRHWDEIRRRELPSFEQFRSDITKAGATIVAAAQSTTSFVPPLGNDKSKVLTLNLRNRLIFRAADEGDAVQAADFLGKKRVVKRSWGFAAGRRNVNYSETEEHKIKPHKLRSLRDHQCIVVHCEKGFRRTVLPPLEPNGNVSPWFKRSWL